MDRDLKTLRVELEQCLTGLDERQTQLRPGGDAARWSIQQTVGHLLLTYAATERAVDARTAKGKATLARPTVLQRVGQAVIVRAGLFPPGRTAPEMVCPAWDEPPVAGGVLIERAARAVESMDSHAAAAEAVFGAEHRAVRHVILGPMSLRDWRRFHLVHGRHHMKVIQRIRREFGV